MALAVLSNRAFDNPLNAAISARREELKQHVGRSSKMNVAEHQGRIATQ
ncbi:hypothetical protein RMSM_01191 [Rhodopirellula maiorica SM1]|uniref:Uncharacterized protein n=1 Tax=Rhodopirellula maiorica SM1 TaxID=1265738 RepID=M5RRR1_9BACT|nr:hypothetical protein RMSM_01191 [Rhodopirellula maiorica SM1]